MMDISEIEGSKTTPDAKCWADEISVRSTSLSVLDQTVLAKLVHELQSKHHLNGVTLGGSPPSLMFRLPETISSDTLNPDRMRFVLWGWPGDFGGCLTITALLKNHGFVSRISLDRGSDVWGQLGNGPCTVVFSHVAGPVAALKVNFAPTDFAREQLVLHLHRVSNYNTTVRDVEAAYWEGIVNNKNLLPYLKIEDKLSCSWVKAFLAIGRHAQEAINKLSDSVLIREYNMFAIPNTSREFLDEVPQFNKQVTKVNEYFTAKLQKRDDWLARFLKDQNILMGVQQLGEETCCPGILFASYLHTSSLTDSGKALPWIDGGSEPQIKKLKLEPESFTEVNDYWARLPSSFFIDWGAVVTGRDVHSTPPDQLKGWATVQLGANIGESEASIETLLDEAAANKKWTIPPHALVDLKFGPFAFCEIVELDHEIYFLLRNGQWHFDIASVNPQTRRWCINVWPDEPGPRQEEVTTAMKLLLAAIVRDFWVVEEREKVFSVSPLPNRMARDYRSQDEESRVIYLPRVRYKALPDLQRCTSALNHHERRQHFVSPHLRRVEFSSKHQLMLAELYGFSVPKGYTFVRPHERGHKKVETIYRSRSALMSLYTTVESAPAGLSRWFQFERDVAKLMELMEYDVQHLAASRRGDQGADVYAMKYVGDKFESWIIQCKCYGPKNKVGPNIVRELVGALSHYESPTKGMIVTTSTFTSGAIEEARHSGIKLIDGKAFSRQLHLARHIAE